MQIRHAPSCTGRIGVKVAVTALGRYPPGGPEQFQRMAEIVIESSWSHSHSTRSWRLFGRGQRQSRVTSRGLARHRRVPRIGSDGWRRHTRPVSTLIGPSPPGPQVGRVEDISVDSGLSLTHCRSPITGIRSVFKQWCAEGRRLLHGVPARKVFATGGRYDHSSQTSEVFGRP